MSTKGQGTGLDASLALMIGRIDERVRRIPDMDTDLQGLTKEMGSVNTRLTLLESEIGKLSKLVYGAVGIVLLTVAGALLSLVINSGG